MRPRLSFAPCSAAVARRPPVSRPAVRSRRATALLLGALPLALAACPPRRGAVAPGTAPSASAATSAALGSASSTVSALRTPSASSSVPLGERCGVRAPAFSDDACSADADCAPLSVCHADACVAAAKAGAMKPGTMCTADCRAGTVDCGCNRCGCVARADGVRRCALVAGVTR